MNEETQKPTKIIYKSIHIKNKIYIIVILVGQSGVGKTCLISMYAKGTCRNTFPTVSVEFLTKEVQMDDGSNVMAQLWDTAGQERFKSLANKYNILYYI